MVVLDWDDNNPRNNEMRSAAMRCVSSLLDCVKFIKDAYNERLGQDIVSYYSRRRAELRRIMKEFEESRK
jgi:hypothetical protein